MTFVSCEVIRPQLEAFHDDELTLEAYLEVRTHLEHCASCACESNALARLREAFDDVPLVTGGRHVRPPDTWAGNLLAQVQLERQMSWAARLTGIFDDMHLVWPALGATAAVLVCLIGSAQVMGATAVQRPDSLAGVIDYLASPGSNVNPARIDEFTVVPRRHAASDWPVASEDAVFTLSTVVTREGRIQRVEMLAAEQAHALKVKREVIDAIIEAASRAEFEPARAGGAPIAVNLVWLLAHTTVVGSPHDVERLIRPVGPPPSAVGPHMPVVVRAKPAAAPVVPAAPSPSPSAAAAPSGGFAFAG
jgi:hypothetical protein